MRGLCDDGMVNVDCRYVGIVVGAVIAWIWVVGENLALYQRSESSVDCFIKPRVPWDDRTGVRAVQRRVWHWHQVWDCLVWLITV